MSMESVINTIRGRFRVRMDAEKWEENLHPRGKDGKFQKKGGGSESTKAEKSHVGRFSAESYSQERKDKALWSKDPAEVDKKVRGVCEKVWRASSQSEQKSAILYTKWANGMFNQPQREAGLKGDFSAQSRVVKELTDVIDRSSYDFDMKLQRGASIEGAASFLGVSEDALKGDIKKLRKELIGSEPIEYGFSSTGAVEGHGSTPTDDKDYTVQYQIYAPSGTKMLYCEPFSWYNKENDNPTDWWDYNWWDGKSKYKGGFSREMEMLIQRNTRYRVTGVNRKRGVLWIDMEVIGQGDE